jgi:amino acid adenylation domain-containing protein/non-ribosomal peptide synthase protein (TIGR01720 family)
MVEFPLVALSAEQQRQLRQQQSLAEAPLAQLLVEDCAPDRITALRALLAAPRLLRAVADGDGWRERADAAEPGCPLFRVDADGYAEALRYHALVQRERIAADWLRTPVDAVALQQGSRCAVLLAAPAWSADAATLGVIARCLRDGSELPEAPDYADFTAWLDELADAPEAAAEQAWWRAALDQAAAQRRPLGAAARQARLGPLPLEARGLDAAGLLARWSALLARRFRLDSVSLGYRATQRGIEALAGAIGPLARELPLTLTPRPQASLAQLQQAAAQALAEADARCLYLREPAADGVSAYRFGFSCGDAGNVLHDTAQACELALAVQAVDGGVQFCLSYDADVLGARDVAWLARQYQRLLQADAREAFDAADLLDDAQRSLLAQTAQPAVAGATTFAARFAELAQHCATQPALQWAQGSLSYAELDAATSRFANFLAAEGCQRGDRVGLCLGRTPEQAIAMVACLKAGFAYVPVDPQTPATRVAAIAARAQFAAIVTSSEYLDKVSEIENEIPLIDWQRDRDWINEASAAAPASAPLPQDEAYVIFTSGSTGVPKGVSVSQGALMHYVDAVLPQLDLTENATLAALSTVAADLGYTAVYGALGSGRTLRLVDEALSLDAQALAAEFAAQPVDCLKIVPSHLGALLDVHDAARVLPARCLVLGGEALSWDLVERVRALRPALRIVNHYGPTETTVGIICNPVGTAPQQRPASAPIGRPIAGSRAYVLDARLARQGLGIEGDLYLAGPSVAAGYLADAAATAQVFLPDPFSAAPGARMYRSGDRAVADAEGDIVFHGRADRQLKIRGFRVEPGEIEAAIRATGLVHNIAVEAIRDGGAARLAAYIGGGEREHETALRARLAAVLPEYMQPALWFWLERLPLNANGKLDRAALPREQTARSAAARREPNATEARLLRLCEELLGLRNLSIEDNFFALGGDSIVAIQLVARARQHGYEFTPKQVFQAESIAALAAMAGRSGEHRHEQGPVSGPVALAPVQARMLRRIVEDVHQYNQACVYDLPLAAGAESLQRVAAQLLSHHDALRARYTQAEDGSWTQEFAAPDAALVQRCIAAVTRDAADEASAEAALREIIQAAQTGFDLAQAPLLRLVQIDLPALDRRHLLVVAHHLVIDAFSWRVLEEDLEALYAAALAGSDATLPPKSASYAQWSGHIAQLHAQGRWQGEYAYWEAIARECADAGSDASAARSGAVRNRTIHLGVDASAALESEVHQLFNTNPQDFLVAALAQAFHDFDGRGALALMLEAHGRDTDDEAPDVSRTIGWFTSLYPVSVAVRGDAEPVALIKAVKERLRAANGQGIGFGVLNYLVPPPAPFPEPQICFNYLGRFNADAPERQRLVPVSAQLNLAQEGVRSPRQSRLFDLEVLALQSESAFTLNLIYDTGRYSEAAVEQICEAFQSRLAVLIAACRASRGGFTPSDVPDLDLGQQELDELMLELEGYEQA